MKRPPKPQAVFRTCECGSVHFRIVGYQNSTYLVCQVCSAPPFRTSQKGHLGRKAMLPREVAHFKGRLGDGA